MRRRWLVVRTSVTHFFLPYKITSPFAATMSYLAVSQPAVFDRHRVTVKTKKYSTT
jgi:hypothetical protein